MSNTGLGPPEAGKPFVLYHELERGYACSIGEVCTDCGIAHTSAGPLPLQEIVGWFGPVPDPNDMLKRHAH